MMTEYVVVGGLLMVMGGVQTWLRFGPWAKEQQRAEQEVMERRAEAARAAREEAGEEESTEGLEGPSGPRPVFTDRGSRLWNKWTAVLGPLGIGFGVVLVIWGVVGG